MNCVLVLDDEVMIAELLREWLIEQGCDKVLVSRTAAEALAHIEANAIDAAILDWTLQQETSAPVAEALRRRGIPFVVATGRDGGEIDGLVNGAPILGKPFEYDAVRTALSQLASR